MELISIQGEKYGSNFIPLHMDIQVLEYHLLKMLVFFSVYFYHLFKLKSPSNDEWIMEMLHIYTRKFYSVIKRDEIIRFSGK